jgi:hypothetical protein
MANGDQILHPVFVGGFDQRDDVVLFLALPKNNLAVQVSWTLFPVVPCLPACVVLW